MSPHPEVLTLAVRSLGLKVDSSSLDTEVKERLSSEPVEYVKMIEQTRETTEELQILKVLQGHDYLKYWFFHRYQLLLLCEIVNELFC